MTKTDLASEPSRLTYPRPPNEPEPKPHDEAQEQKSFWQQEPERSVTQARANTAEG
jgi:hypothetical protein